MEEVEVKLLDIDPETCGKMLEKLGATPVFDGDIRTRFYDFADERIAKSRDLLRLRLVGSDAHLTYKEFVSDTAAKRRTEHEVAVGDFTAMHAILVRLGLSPSEDVLKHRTSYRLGPVRFEIDVHRGAHSFIPPLLEIEGPDLRTVREAATHLGFPPEACRPWSFFDVVVQYRRNNL
jgi:predicted adenylyl cyclase CyaB